MRNWTTTFDVCCGEQINDEPNSSWTPTFHEMLFGEMLQMLILMTRFKSSDNTEKLQKLQDPSLKLKVDRMDKIAGSHDLPSTEGFCAAFKTAQANVMDGTDYGVAAYLSTVADRAIQAIEKMNESLMAVRTSLPNEPQCPADFQTAHPLGPPQGPRHSPTVGS